MDYTKPTRPQTRLEVIIVNLTEMKAIADEYDAMVGRLVKKFDVECDIYSVAFMIDKITIVLPDNCELHGNWAKVWFSKDSHQECVVYVFEGWTGKMFALRESYGTTLMIYEAVNVTTC